MSTSRENIHCTYFLFSLYNNEQQTKQKKFYSFVLAYSKIKTKKKEESLTVARIHYSLNPYIVMNELLSIKLNPLSIVCKGTIWNHFSKNKFWYFFVSCMRVKTCLIYTWRRVYYTLEDVFNIHVKTCLIYTRRRV